MTPVEVKLERLAALGFQFLPAASKTHVILERGGFVALVERTSDGLGAAGSPGLLTTDGFAALIWRGSTPYFVFKKREQQATEEEVDGLRRFSSDLERALD